ncbi:bifunctional YncE family protein/alkaline phosphatase family protein [Cognataquiflexum rubidum]|uniref:bifunctional YncE family protein/alkaline phosphatase family protein n=1 Tax=Cognataquiflexum rubidum TaxID=2922273 RepID=UPI001F1297E3|nr:bifunctional YncE family protein/alkaline phosphatase family protein [Cognataquiflexum rubidum]MCH6236021.1 bifunctional YncE family protein/alkaline phosphatase family protein [Cognataquiflexum rubidum]
MRPLLFISLLLFSFACQNPRNVLQEQESKETQALRKNRVQLPNGWSLTPVGNSLNLQDLPLNLVVSPSKTMLAVTNNGQSTQSITLIDAQSEKILDEVTIAKAFLGLAFSPDEKYLYASGGNDNKILIYKIVDKKLILDGEIVLAEPWPVKVSPAGLTVTDQYIYVVAKENNSLYKLNIASKSIEKRVDLPAEPYTCLLSPDNKTLYVSIWGGARIWVMNSGDLSLKSSIATDKNPNDMVLSKDGKYLFASHGNDNTVSLINTESMTRIEILSCSLFPDAPLGSTPNGVALSEDEKTLYIANADNNCLAVFDVETKGKSRPLGFIPTGWYPTAVKTIGNKVYLTNGKGFSSFPNPDGPNPVSSTDPQYKGPNPQIVRGSQYIGGLFKGTLSMFDAPNERQLAEYTNLVYENTPYTKEKEMNPEGEKGNPIPMKVGEDSPIKYVFYIIKENRTYDQILGDMEKGNGDPSLCLFPEKVTPNLHALANEFVLLDNFYVDAEVSADGHNWSTAAYANDYVEKSWVSSYGGRGGTYDYEGSRKIAHPKNGYLWDFAIKEGLSVRSYGIFTGTPEMLPNLQNNICKKYPDYDLSIKDSLRFEIWKTDFDSLLAIQKVPRLSFVRMGNDHTAGARLGMPTTSAMVADNDLAVGMFVEHLSKSSIWESSVVFILEDDAQNGSDHVDAHRSTAFVAGGFVKRNYVDHTAYTTTGMLRTIELILGIPPMSQYDAAATPMFRCFSPNYNSQGFTKRNNQVDLNEMNVEFNKNAVISANMDFSKPDLIDDLELNRIVWQSVRGLDSEMPAPKRSAFLRFSEKEEDEDDKE